MNRWGPPKPTKASSMAAFKTFLASARSLDGFTAPQLARLYGVEPKVAEYELIIARQKRQATGE